MYITSHHSIVQIQVGVLAFHPEIPVSVVCYDRITVDANGLHEARNMYHPA